MRPNRFSKRAGRRGACLGALGALALAGILSGGARIGPVLFVNTTDSMPKGIYVLSSRRPVPGSLVIVRTRGLPRFGLQLPEYLVKEIAAESGERVTIDRQGLSVDGKLVAPRAADMGVTFTGRLPRGEAVVVGRHPRSFDSRYFGPVPLAGLQTVAPLWTW